MPKQWIEENRLSKGSTLVLEKNGDSISLSPPKGGNTLTTPEETDTTIYVDDKDPQTVLQMLTSAYLRSHSTIYVIGEKLSTMLPELKSYAQKLIALEIVESNKTKVVLKDFLDFSAIHIPESLRKMDIIIRSMFIDVKNPERINDVIERDNEVDRLFFVVRKAIWKGMNDPATLKAINIPLPQLMTHANNAYALESLADEIQRFAEQSKQHKLSKAAHHDVQKIVEQTNQLYLDTMRAVHKKDAPKAFSSMMTKEGIIQDAVALQKKYAKEPPVPVLAEIIKRMARINHSMLRRVGEY